MGFKEELWDRFDNIQQYQNNQKKKLIDFKNIIEQRAIIEENYQK